MIERFRVQAVRAAVVGALAVIAAGCGSDSGLSAGPSPVFSAGTIEVAPPDVIAGTWVTFESRSASDPSGGALSYHWDFGDGSTATGAAASHVYASEGDFFATLTVNSSEAGSAMTSVLVSVRSTPPQRP